MRDGLAHGKLELLANLRQRTDVVPGNLRGRGEPLALRRGLDLGQREREVVDGYGEVGELGRVERASVRESPRTHQRLGVLRVFGVDPRRLVSVVRTAVGRELLEDACDR